MLGSEGTWIKGTWLSRISVTCDLAFTCDGRAVVKGVGGGLADLRATATSHSEAGRATVVLRVTCI
jgi:hypothetical protein